MSIHYTPPNEEECLEVLKELGPPYFIGSKVERPVGSVITLHGHPFQIKRLVAEGDVLAAWWEKAKALGYEIDENAEFDRYYELATD